MDCNCGNSDLLEFTSKPRRRQMLTVPAESHFHRDGNGNRLNDSTNKINSAVHLTHQAGPCSNLGDAIDRTTHIDVDGINAACLQQLGSVTHD